MVKKPRIFTIHGFKIWHFDVLPSTHMFLKQALRQHEIVPPAAVFSDVQTQGIGSRGDHWTGLFGNLFASFVVDKRILPQDVPLQSLSIYAAMILKKLLAEKGSKVWVKWPNDFHIGKNKCGGLISELVSENVLFGIGINLINAPKNAACLDVKIQSKALVADLVKALNKLPKWKAVFKDFKVEFHLHKKNIYTHTEGRVISLREAILEKDGSLRVKNKRIFSLR